MQFKTEPLGYQRKAFDKLKDALNGAIFLTMGRGKSKIAIDLMAYKFLQGQITHALIVSPNLVHTQWVNEQLPIHCPVPYVAHAYLPLKTKAYKWELLNYLNAPRPEGSLKILSAYVDAFSHSNIDDVLENFIVSGKTMIILDEATRAKNPSSKRTKKLVETRKWCAGPAIILTGTALAKRVSDVWSLYNFLDYRIINQPKMMFDVHHTVLIQRTFEVNRGRRITKTGEIDEYFWNRVKRMWWSSNRTMDDIFDIATRLHMSPEDIRFIAETPKFAKYKHVDELKEHLSPITVFTDANDDVVLPPKTYRTVELALDDVQVQMLKQLKQYAVTAYEGKIMALSTAASLGMKALQICGGFFSPMTVNNPDAECVPIACKNAKLEFILDQLDEIGDAQFLIFAVFTREIELIASELSKQGVTCGKLYGAASNEERVSTVERFKSGDIQCVVCNPSVAGYGLNLQGAALQIWYSRDYNTENRLQAEGRSSRIGSTKTAVYIDLVYSVPFEKKVLESNKEGRSLNEFFMNASLNDIMELL